MSSIDADVVDLTHESEEEGEHEPAGPSTAAAAGDKRKAPAETAAEAAAGGARERQPAGRVKQKAATAPAAEPAEPILGGAKRAPVKVPTEAQARERMHTMLHRFELDPASVDALLQSSEALIAGGAALHTFMGQPVDGFSGDLDVFAGEEALPQWRQLLEAAGYRFRPFQRRGETVVPDDPADLQEMRLLNAQMAEAGYDGGNGIVQVLDFVRHSGSQERKVQVIVCLAPLKAPEGFDLSAAATYWDGRTLRNNFPWLTRRWLTFWQNMDSPVGRSHSPARLAKYESKGFTLLPDGGPYIDVPAAYGY